MASDLLDYIAQEASQPGARVPPISELSEALGISPSKLREQLEVARALGIVDVRPKTGIRTRDVSYLPPLRLGLLSVLAREPARFEEIRSLRTTLEAAYWKEAVALLLPEDLDRLERLVAQAWEKLRGAPIQIPHAEHRALHLTVFARLPNLLVRALLEAYWEAYEAVGLSLYADYAYLHEVWTYHESMVAAIRRGDPEAGLQALVRHTGLLRTRSVPPGETGLTAAPAGNWKGDLG
ncbi:MAG TPA: FCD domain-containing protein [Anaerolineales bacterium]|nr:FCD domain-containing protein [Anaerolineales bacterium]